MNNILIMKTLSINIADELYFELKSYVQARQVSKFVTEAIASKLHKKQSLLEQEYIAASKDKARFKDLEDWNALDLEGWDE